MNSQTRNNKSEKEKRNLGFPYRSGRPILPKSDEIVIKEPKPFKCPRCHKVIIKDLEEYLKTLNRSYDECCNCDFRFYWRNYIYI